MKKKRTLNSREEKRKEQNSRHMGKEERRGNFLFLSNLSTSGEIKNRVPRDHLSPFLFSSLLTYDPRENLDFSSLLKFLTTLRENGFLFFSLLTT